MRDSTPMTSDSPRRWTKAFLPLLLMLVPIAFNAFALWPEAALPTPSLNDDAVHYLMIQRASEAFANRETPIDSWVPELELGFPHFFYYQHLPHVTVVVLHRLLLGQVGLLTVFNGVRYVLLIAFPLTVYWSMRRMGFSMVSAAVAGAFAGVLASGGRYGFDYDSYVWRGHGMYTQLWAMHLSFVTLGCLYRLMERGRGYVAATVACALLALSHLVYAYMMAVTALVLWLVGLSRANARRRVARLAVVGGLAAVISSYMWLPFLLNKPYLSASPYLQRWKYDSFGAGHILAWLVDGDLLDHGRLPTLTVLLALGVAAALFSAARAARFAVVLFGVWLGLFFGRPTWGPLVDVLPMHEGLLFHRFIGGVHLAAILLIGLGGEWIWRRTSALPDRWRAVTVALVVLALMTPALRERHAYYMRNTQWMERTRRALDADGDARAILAALRSLPPGRTYAGLRENWGKELTFGDVHFYDLLTFHRIVATSPPYSSWSLNADLIWHFDDTNPAHYELFNVSYVVAPRGWFAPAFLHAIKETRRYVLYQAETGGYARFATIVKRTRPVSQSSLFDQNRRWFLSADPGAGRFVRYDFPRGGHTDAASDDTPASATVQAACAGGRVIDERIGTGRFDVRTTCDAASALAVKATYHPNWRATIDGRPAEVFMMSPSFIGVEVPRGAHSVTLEYRSPIYKTVLLFLGAGVLCAALLSRARFERFDAALRKP